MAVQVVGQRKHLPEVEAAPRAWGAFQAALTLLQMHDLLPVLQQPQWH